MSSEKFILINSLDLTVQASKNCQTNKQQLSQSSVIMKPLITGN